MNGCNAPARIGPRMRAVAALVAESPGITKGAAARSVSKCTRAGYATVNRTVAAGLISQRRIYGENRIALFPVNPR